MAFRKWFFGVFFLLSLGWMCYGFSAVGNAVNTVSATPGSTGRGVISQKEANNYRDAGVAIGASIGLGVYVCTGLPFMLLFGLLAWRNAAGETNARKHKEVLDAQAKQADILRQQLLQQQAQLTQMQMGQMQQFSPHPIQPQPMSQQVKDQFSRAQELIKNKKYKDARKLLHSIDHPRAGEWLTKLDAMGV